MPTPSDDTLCDASPPTAISVESRNGHATCPPEDERQPHVDSRARERIADLSDNATSDGSVPRAQTVTPGVSGAQGIASFPETSSKHMAAVEEALRRETQTPATTSEDIKDSDARLAHSMSATAISSSLPPAYPIFPETSKRVMIHAVRRPQSATFANRTQVLAELDFVVAASW